MDLLTYIEQSPTIYHAVENAKKILLADGAEELRENQDWQIETGKSYVVTRNGAALIAFRVPEDAENFRVFAAHGDSPCFKIKENPEIVVEDKYVKLNVERYGGMICSSWFDRPLSVAGRVIVKDGDGLSVKLVKIDRNLLVIPNLAIHMNREINDGYKYNAQVDMLPLYGGIESKGTFMKLIAEAAGVQESEILSHDLFLYNREKAVCWGADQAYISGPRFDDLECVAAGLQGFLNAPKEKNIAVFCLFDNEEVGSGSRQGAASTFLLDTLIRIGEARGENHSRYVERISGSFMLSADNGHAVHPNHTDKTDPTNRPVMNGGVLLKYSANQRYTTDGFSAAFFKDLCREAEVPYQIFFNRSDMLGGSTLGNISTSQVPFATVDIGLAQLAMHSAYETVGAKDMISMEKLAEALYR